MAKVIILCGKIASGKTFYAEQLRKKTNAIILSVDVLMLQLSDECLGGRHDDIALRCERYFYQLAEQIISSGMYVIIDFGYWTKKERDIAKDYFRRAGIPMELHYIKVPEDIRLKQLENRNKLLLKKRSEESSRSYIINQELRIRLDAKFEEPLPSEYDKMIHNFVSD